MARLQQEAGSAGGTALGMSVAVPGSEQICAGKRVEVLFGDGTWYPGTVSSVTGDQWAAVKFDDGDRYSVQLPDPAVRLLSDRASSIRENKRQRTGRDVSGGTSSCEHNRRRRYCKECGGSSICEHNRRRAQCRECGGASICEHNRRRTQCKQCGGGSICEHDRIRSSCAACRGSSAVAERAPAPAGQNRGKKKKRKTRTAHEIDDVAVRLSSAAATSSGGSGRARPERREELGERSERSKRVERGEGRGEPGAKREEKEESGGWQERRRGRSKERRGAASSMPEAAGSEMKRECVVCLAGSKSYVCVPCMHVCLCAACAGTIPRIVLPMRSAVSGADIGATTLRHRTKACAAVPRSVNDGPQQHRVSCASADGGSDDGAAYQCAAPPPPRSSRSSSNRECILDGRKPLFPERELVWRRR